MTDYFSGRESFRLSFVMLSATEQRSKIAELSRRGWSPGSLSKLTGWSPQRVMEAIRNQPQEPRQ